MTVVACRHCAHDPRTHSRWGWAAEDDDRMTTLSGEVWCLDCSACRPTGDARARRDAWTRLRAHALADPPCPC